jgi:ribosomal protein S18 acetylase RimI-like enzyme
MPLTFTVLDKIDPTEAKLLAQGLTHHAKSVGVETELMDLGIFARDEQGEVIGGVTAQTGWSLCYIKLLWVHESQRRQGLGRKLIHMVEEQALKRGCHTMGVDTYNYQGPEFYPKIGFQEFGRIDGLGPDRNLTRTWFMKRIG